MGCGVGAAILGLRPVVEVDFTGFLYLGLDQLVNNAAKLRYMSDGQLRVPLVVRVGQGPTGLVRAPSTRRSLHGWLANVPGLVVCAPSTAQDAYDLMRWSLRQNGPRRDRRGPAALPARRARSSRPRRAAGGARAPTSSARDATRRPGHVRPRLWPGARRGGGARRRGHRARGRSTCARPPARHGRDRGLGPPHRPRALRPRRPAARRLQRHARPRRAEHAGDGPARSGRAARQPPRARALQPGRSSGCVFPSGGSLVEAVRALVRWEGRRETAAMPQLALGDGRGGRSRVARRARRGFAAGRPSLEIETDKATMEVEAPFDGVLVAQACAEGDTVAVGAVIGHAVEPGGTPSAGARRAPRRRRRAAAAAPRPGAGPRRSAAVAPASAPRPSVVGRGRRARRTPAAGPSGPARRPPAVAGADGPRPPSPAPSRERPLDGAGARSRGGWQPAAAMPTFVVTPRRAARGRRRRRSTRLRGAASARR